MLQGFIGRMLAIILLWFAVMLLLIWWAKK